MSVDDKIVDKIAELARLEFNANDKESIKSDLNKTLAFVDKLNELDTQNVDPLIYMLDEVAVLRKDEVGGQVSQKEALKNAPDKDSDYFKVPTVLKK